MENPHFLPPGRIAGRHLDECLRQGGYRMGQRIFSVDYIFYEGEWLRVFWLRFDLSRYTPSRSHRRILRGLSAFECVHRPVGITDEHEEVYGLYRGSVDFDASDTASMFLYSRPSAPGTEVFDSRMIEVRDAGKLVALGVYDMGEDSMAGILNFYHPDYASVSPGKMLMLEKIRSARESGLAYFYPGYVAVHNPRFDYKTFPGEDACEFFEPFSQVWRPYSRSEMEALAEEQSIYFGPVTEDDQGLP